MQRARAKADAMAMAFFMARDFGVIYPNGWDNSTIRIILLSRESA
jgi:hypothetical protein